jgi:AcrR family transcriptional regulator
MVQNSTVTEKILQLKFSAYALSTQMDRDEELLEEPFSDDRVHRVFVDELGGELADALRRVRRFQEAEELRRHPEEGLRERKRRLTRQRISDVATILFGARGFDNVKVSEVADIVGVSEKTVYNYFPTKESMVLDWADEAVESMARVIRECPPNESLTAAVVRAMKEDMERFDDVPDDIVMFLPRFVDLIDSTPALRAAWLEMHDRIVTVVTEALAARAEVDPRDPEPMIAARALSGLGGVALAARVRYIEQGLRGAELRDAVLTDLERAARLLDTGLWSFNLLTHGRRTRQQVLDAAKSTEEARQQVVKALRQARTAWRQIREESRDAMREQQAVKRGAMRDARRRRRD